jgi:hypothetical protein
MLVGVLAYLLAFAAALLLDQPFGPVAVVMLLFAGLIAAASRKA